MTEITIEDATRADTADLLAMIAALTAHHGDASQATEDTLERDLFGPRPIFQALIAKAEGRAVGYAAMARRAMLHQSRRGMDLHHLYVAPERRGSGLGRRLIETVVRRAEAEGYDYITVSADKANTGAQNTYLACGFALRETDGVSFRMELPREG
ncbi:GNAT family N-acetyltransferase [Pseudoroseicyclus aestuarii]|uniref:Acetyltransferase (GNAT) family protein n=1 Tax=Pseudoroseicyclus aestuarii TaxID=1795041 RepID=A0A318SS72_9RHOB|nr:GNAT family N-acetyltransferase [Pseudoroseicyclus aestuarii]PYE84553.1 acetyltransferase (GNAT) family protein [Pseudoroseicyclus aestuarii]